MAARFYRKKASAMHMFFDLITQIFLDNFKDNLYVSGRPMERSCDLFLEVEQILLIFWDCWAYLRESLTSFNEIFRDSKYYQVLVVDITYLSISDLVALEKRLKVVLLAIFWKFSSFLFSKKPLT